jgi:hypothetical protein
MKSKKGGGAKRCNIARLVLVLVMAAKSYIHFYIYIDLVINQV